jgi:hypothetical protein
MQKRMIVRFCGAGGRDYQKSKWTLPSGLKLSGNGGWV